MDFEWVAIALGDVTWISLAFALGFLSRTFGLPPLIGFLATGFLLNALGISSGEMLQKLADLGITLLLFIVGLKLNIRMLARPQVWAVTCIHTSVIVGLFGCVIYGIALAAGPMHSDLDIKKSLLVAFALSFSSTVFVVKALEDKGEVMSLHGRIAIGILIMQDLAAVIFLALSLTKLPSLWALLLLLLFPLRPLLHHLLQKTGHGELMILYGLVLALGGAEAFELAGVKDDLGALILGVLISTHPKSAELAKSMLSFKDLFLVGFFLSIGITGQLTIEALIIGLLLLPFIFIKSALFFELMTFFRLRARTSLLTTLNLSNYSEFGLIVAAIGVANGWLDREWLVILAIALSFSFILAASLNSINDGIYRQFRNFWMKFQSDVRLPDDTVIDTLGASIAIFGLGRTGRGAFEKMRELHGDNVVGVDFNDELIKRHLEEGRRVVLGDPGDADFWDKIAQHHHLKIVMLALPNLQANLDALEQLKKISFSGYIAATARFPDEEKVLRQSGASDVFNIYTQVGEGFADHVNTRSQESAQISERRQKLEMENES